jgi:cell division protein FtsN
LPPIIDSSPDNKQTNLSDSYVLQLGTFREKNRAEFFSRQMNEKGFESFIEPTSLGQGETGYRVRVGPYSELLTAQETAQDILTKSGQRVLIVPLRRERQGRSDHS